MLNPDCSKLQGSNNRCDRALPSTNPPCFGDGGWVSETVAAMSEALRFSGHQMLQDLWRCTGAGRPLPAVHWC